MSRITFMQDLAKELNDVHGDRYTFSFSWGTELPHYKITMFNQNMIQLLVLYIDRTTLSKDALAILDNDKQHLTYYPFDLFNIDD